MRKQLDILLARLFTRLPVLARIWGKFADIATSSDVPWTPIRRPLEKCRVCLITTGGLHLKRDRPFDMDDPDGDPTYRVIPVTATKGELTITHNYYNHRAGDRDFNILLPLERLRELIAAGYVGGMTQSHYSFMGHIDGPHVATLEQRVIPELLGKLKAEEPDFVFLTPA